MTILFETSFADFMKMRDTNHIKFQLYYYETETDFDFYMILGSGSYQVTTISKDNIYRGLDPKSQEGFIAMDAFKRGYMNDAIKVGRILCSDVSEFDIRQINNLIDDEEFNTNEAFNTEQGDESPPETVFTREELMS